MTDEIVADYDIRSPASRTLLTVLGTLAVFGLLVGAVLGASLLMRDTKESTSIIDLGNSAQIEVNATSADIHVVEGSSDVVKVTSRVTSGIRKTDYQIGRRGDEIKIISGCQSLISPGCGVSVTLEVPKGLPIVVNTTSGNVTAAGISKGVLTVSSGSGDLTGSRLGVDEFSAETASGDIDATFADQPFAFKAISGSGDIAATLPAGKRTYDVRATSKSGDVSSKIPSDAKGAGFVVATSKSGDITLRSR
ncbi:MAG: hypothetical protein QOJ72_1932 [Nocardioidaceae bacterium]|jgi:DUF4097 and DUF4098 domain-containing protein YvlB|nr:hypothetical protein [Nocardioidaceae bacterium]